MTVPQELKEKWITLYSSGDFEAIAKESGFSSVTIRGAVSKGECTDRIFEAIAGFYKKKEGMIEKYMG